MSNRHDKFYPWEYNTIQVVLKDCDIQVIIPRPRQDNLITSQRIEVEDNLGDIIIQNCRNNVTPEFEAVKLNFQTYLGRPWKNYSKIVIMENSMSDIIQSAEWFEWEGTSVGLNTLFYLEYKNFRVGDTSKRVT